MVTKTSKARKYIVGMVALSGRVEMFNAPTEYTLRADAEDYAEAKAKAHRKCFEVFVRCSSFSPSTPPVVKTTYK